MFMLKFITIWLIGFVYASALNAQSVNRHAVLITEVFPDPLPSVGLPTTEFIELMNVSDTTINLLGWKIADGSSVARISIPFLLKPDSMVILCPSSSILNWEPYGTAIGI